MTVFSKNLKRLRLAKNFTQEQAAQALGVSTQSISRWECSITLPDVTMLPAIARLYCVTIDDLYKENAVAYDNYAQRLASIYRSTWSPEDFAAADREFQKLRLKGTATFEDLRQYGILHQYMMRRCMVSAEALFDEILTQAEGDIYWRTKRQKIYFLSLIGRSGESIDAQRRALETASDAYQDWICLIAAYQYARDFDNAYLTFQKAAQKFPDVAMVWAYGGDICQELGRIEEAFQHWNAALKLDPSLCDAKHSKAFCYESIGEYQKAHALWCSISEDLEKKGFYVEAARSRERAAICLSKVTA